MAAAGSESPSPSPGLWHISWPIRLRLSLLSVNNRPSIRYRGNNRPPSGLGAARMARIGGSALLWCNRTDRRADRPGINRQILNHRPAQAARRVSLRISSAPPLCESRRRDLYRTGSAALLPMGAEDPSTARRTHVNGGGRAEGAVQVGHAPICLRHLGPVRSKRANR